MSHANARLTPAGRLIMVQRIQSGRAVAHVAAEMGISRTAAWRWWRRFREHGPPRPTSGNAWLDARRTGTTSYRAQIGSGGSLALQVRFSSTTTTVASGFTAAAGDRIGIRVVGSTVQLLKNGVVLATVPDTQITAIGTCQLVATSTTVAGVWDDVIVRTINYPEAA